MPDTATETNKIEFGTEIRDLFKLTDEVFLERLAWSSPTLSDKASAGPVKLATALQKIWLSRFEKDSIRYSAKKRTALWSQDSFPNTPFTTKLEEVLAKGTPKKNSPHLNDLPELLQETSDVFPKVSPADLLLVTELLLTSFDRFSAEAFFAVWRWTLSQYLVLAAKLETCIGTRATPDQVLLLSGELPWLGGLLFDEISGAKEFRKSGRKTLKAALSDNIDNDGSPNAVLLDRAEWWISSLVRSAHWGSLFGKPLWKGESEELYDALLDSVAQLCLAEGRLALAKSGSEQNHPPFPEVVHRGMILSGFSPKSKSVRYLAYLREGSVKKNSQALIDSRKWGRVKKPISTQSDWAELACLRTGWSLDHDSIILAHHCPIPQIAMSVAGKTLFHGEWGIELKVRGRKRRLTADWSCTCWYSDREVDYLEIQLPLNEQLHLDRQVYLSRNDHYALLIDSVAGTNQQKFELTSSLPIEETVQTETDRLTREIRLKYGSESIRVLPLGLPQYRTHSATGELLVEENQLVLKQNGQSAGVSALLLDWSPKRRRLQPDWRMLTITENRRKLLPSEAFAARIRFKNQQWLYYRDLISDKEWPHAVLGMHCNHETVFGKFDSDGDVQPIVHVE